MQRINEFATDSVQAADMTYKAPRQLPLSEDSTWDYAGQEAPGHSKFDAYESCSNGPDIALIDDGDRPWQEDEDEGKIVVIKPKKPGADWLRLQNIKAGKLDVCWSEQGRRTISIACTANILPHESRAHCPNPRIVKDGRKFIKRRDLCLEPETPTWLHIQWQRFKCMTCNKIIYADTSVLDDKRMITRRLRDQIAYNALKWSFKDVSNLACVDINLVRRVWEDFAEPRLIKYELTPPRVLGIDEVYLYSEMRFVCMNLETDQLLDIFRMPSDSQLEIYFAKLAKKNVVKFICLDMSRNYASKIRSYFPDSTVVVDRFHVTQRANMALNDARIEYLNKVAPKRNANLITLDGLSRITKEQYNELKSNWRLLLARKDLLHSRSRERLRDILKQHPHLEKIHRSKAEFLKIYEVSSKEEARSHYEKWRRSIEDIPHVKRALRPIVRMMKEWGKEIYNFHDGRYSNARMERMNRSIRDVCRKHGYMEPLMLRAKALLALGALPDTPSGSRIDRVARGFDSPFGQCRPKRKVCTSTQGKRQMKTDSMVRTSGGGDTDISGKV